MGETRSVSGEEECCETSATSAGGYRVEEEEGVGNRRTEEEQLGSESFQPHYQPYHAPHNAYEPSYAPVEQKSIEAAVAAGAAAYHGENYADPQRLSFQIHGQKGPHSYRFGYDTGLGYNR